MEHVERLQDYRRIRARTRYVDRGRTVPTVPNDAAAIRWRLICRLLRNVDSETQKLIHQLEQIPVTRRRYRDGQPGGGSKVQKARKTDTERPPICGKFPPKHKESE